MHNSTIQCNFFYLIQIIEYIRGVLVSTQNRLCFQSKLHTLLLLGIFNWYCCWWMGWLIVAGVGWLIMGATSASCNKTVWALILHINIQITLQLNSNARSLNASWNQLQSACLKDPPKEIWIWTQFSTTCIFHMTVLVGPTQFASSDTTVCIAIESQVQ